MRTLTRLAMTMALLVATALQARADGYRVLVYGDSNTWGWKASSVGLPTVRLPPSERWSGLLGQHLGPDYEIEEDGLNLRTTNLDDPVGGGGQLVARDYNGAASLPATLAQHAPLDLVVLALGQNDLQSRYGRSAGEVADAIAELVAIIQRSEGEIGTTYPAPDVLVLPPLPVPEVVHPVFAPEWSKAHETSRQTIRAIRTRGVTVGFDVLDVSAMAGEIEGSDGLHFSLRQHRIIARAVADAVTDRLDQNADLNELKGKNHDT